MFDIIKRIVDDSSIQDRFNRMPDDYKKDPNYQQNWLYSASAVAKADLLTRDRDDSLKRGERLAQWLHEEKFEKLRLHIWQRNRISHKLVYDVQNDLHNNPRAASSVSLEKNIARLMCRESIKGHLFGQIGKVLNFEVPLYEAKAEPYRCIDMVSYSEAEDKLYLLELKKPRSQESLLRCILEVYTYVKAIGDWESFRDNFSQRDGVGIGKETKIVIAPLVFETVAAKAHKKSDKSIPYEDYQMMESASFVDKLLADIRTDLQRHFDDDANHLEFAFLNEKDPVIKGLLQELGLDS